MPKAVDHAARREELAAALWRVVMRDGIEAASIRRVATEAGWSSGSLRHYFDTQSDLLAFAMELVMRRARRRIEALADDPDPRAWAEKVLHEVLPLDDERRAEMHVWLAFTTRAAVDRRLAALRDEAHAALRGLCRQLGEALGSPDPDVDGERLHAFVDGLALHAVLTPQVTTPARQKALVAAELAALAPHGGGLRGPGG
jgi:AcrR family transcriptional regulator